MPILCKVQLKKSIQQFTKQTIIVNLFHTSLWILFLQQNCDVAGSFILANFEYLLNNGIFNSLLINNFLRYIFFVTY